MWNGFVSYWYNTLKFICLSVNKRGPLISDSADIVRVKCMNSPIYDLKPIKQFRIKLSMIVPLVQLLPESILLCASTFFSKYACFCRMFSRTPHCLPEPLDNTQWVQRTFSTKKALTKHETNSCMFLAHDLTTNEQIHNREQSFQHWNSSICQSETSASTPCRSAWASDQNSLWHGCLVFVYIGLEKPLWGSGQLRFLFIFWFYYQNEKRNDC